MFELPTSTNPTTRLLAGLAIICVAVALFSAYSRQQISGLRELQLEAIDRNRRDSLQLLRIQDNLQNVALSMRDIAEGVSPYPITAWKTEFDRIRRDLEDALEKEGQLAPAARTVQQQSFLRDSLAGFWDVMDGMFQTAEGGNDTEARRLIREVLQPRHASIANTVARLLISNNEAEQEAAAQIQRIYDNVERNTYYFMAAVFVAIFLTGGYMLIQNRRIFRDLAELSEQRQVLAGQLINVQEDLFESVARELHDEFGQALTAAGAMLTRLERKSGSAPQELRSGLIEAREVTQQALDGVRRLSQRLHPNVLDDFGLEGAVEWHVKQIRDQTGLEIEYHKPETPLPAVDREAAIHVYRVLQEALSNVLKHSGSQHAQVRLTAADGQVQLEVEDNGRGFPAAASPSKGLGMVAMRERAQLIHGRLAIEQPPGGGTLVRLRAPIRGTKAQA
ncbi:MAG TPA: ATP-binding protein [Bryobacterales bacterium]|nr:ATP-binding protein [Bryobacterales bacterium]